MAFHVLLSGPFDGLRFVRCFAVLTVFASCLVKLSSAGARSPSFFSAQISHSGPVFEDDDVAAFFAGVDSQHAVSKRSNDQYYYNTRLKYSKPVDQAKAAFLEAEHNKYRRMVPATNMEYMYWDDNLAASAQQHADRCDFFHSRDRPRGTGENIWSDNTENYGGAVAQWFGELHQYSCNEYWSSLCGHFTQVVKADSGRFGCGFATCDYVANIPGMTRRNVLVCQYSSSNKLGRPAFIATSGGKGACSECPSHAGNCREGLCIS